MLRRLVSRAIYFLLSNQFVVGHTLKDTYKCHKGSGIGLLISAIIASLFFYVEVEQHFVSSLPGLCKWVRYHDDVIAVFSSKDCMLDGLAHVKSLAKPTFRVVCESVNSVGKQLTFLDLSVRVLVTFCCVSASQHKPVTPLCPTSAHFPSVHKSWPNSVSRRVHILSGGDWSEHKLLCSRYQLACAHPYTLKLFETWTDLQPARSIAPVLEGPALVPFVLRYHPCTRWALWRTMQLVPVPQELNIVLRPSWRNALPSLQALIRRATHQSCIRDSEFREGCCFFDLESVNLVNNNMCDFKLTVLRSH